MSCEYLQVQSKKEASKTLIASVGDANLYKEDLQNILPDNFSKQDSTVLIKSYINTWAKEQLLLQKAEENVTEVNSNEIDDLVKKYRQSLYINGYKEKLIKQQLDTVIKRIDVIRYYKQNKENFKLNEELFKIKFVHFGKDFLDVKETIERFKSDKEEDLEALENQTINFKDYVLRNSTWITHNDLIQKIPPFRRESKEKLLKISKYIQKEDRFGVYLVAVNEVLLRNDVAPLSYIEDNIKQIILHKRKLELIRDIEKTLINDAIKNNNFKEY